MKLKLIDEDWIDRRIKSLQEARRWISFDPAPYNAQINLLYEIKEGQLQSPVEEIRSAIEYGLNSFEDFDRTSNYDEESRKEGLKEIQEDYLKEKGYEYNT